MRNGSRSRRCGWDGSYPEVIQIRRPFQVAPFSADRSRDSGLHDLFYGFLPPGFGPQSQPGLEGFTGSVLSLPAYCSHHTTLQLRSVSRLFRCPCVQGRFRCLATPAFDFNFFELLTLGIFTTEGEKKKKNNNNNRKNVVCLHRLSCRVRRLHAGSPLIPRRFH